MRADRLLAILLLLQGHPRLSAEQLAARLEVSPRTVQRDMLALSAAGVPVVASRGSGGGWSLLEGFRTELSGLTLDETHALSLLAPAQVLDDLGLRQSSITALIKLLAGLPEWRRRTADDFRQRVLVDAAGWRPNEEAAPAFRVIQEAVWSDRQARVRYQRNDGERVERILEPLGLVAKGRVWYVVARSADVSDDVVRTYRISRIVSADLLNVGVSRPEGFDLATFWESSQSAFAASLPTYIATLQLRAERLAYMRAMWRYTTIGEASDPSAQGWIRAEVIFENLEEACFCALGMGTDVEILAPDELRALVASRAAAVTSMYRTMASR